METVHFMGYIEPQNLKLTLENVTPIVEFDKATGVTNIFTLAILECVLSVECQTDDFQKIGVSRLYTRSYEIARTDVNLVSLKMGWGLIVHIDTFIPASGVEETVMNKVSSLRSTCQSFEMDNID